MPEERKIERTTKSVFLRLPRDMHWELQKKANKTKKSIQKIIMEIIDEHNERKMK